MNTTEKIKILYIDDEKNNLVAFKANYRHEFTIFIAESAKEGVTILENNIIQIIVTDQRMPDITGVQFLESIIQTFPDPIRIILTGYTDMETVVQAVNKGKVFQYINKPYNIDEVRNIFLLAYQEYEKTKKIIRDNAQYEFLLRQKLLQ